MTAPVLTIDIGAIVANWRRLAAMHSGETAAVVKANAYGLGIGVVAPALTAAGCQRFFVATPDEAIALRQLVGDAWIAVLNGCPKGREGEFVVNRLTPVLNSLEDCAQWRTAGGHAGHALPAMLHIDTGMSRLGLDDDELGTVLRDRSRLDSIDIAYVMSHLSAAEMANSAETAAQIDRFSGICAQFPGIDTSLANSSGLFLGSAAASDLARPGIALFGGNPTPGHANPMQPVIELTAPVLQLRVIHEGDTVGYNSTWRAPRRSRIATIGVGYADGLPRSLSNRMTARHHGRVIRQVGRISMDLTTLDVTDQPDIAAGAQIELVGPGHDVDDLAGEAGTIAYEILTSLGQRYRRVAKSV